MQQTLACHCILDNLIEMSASSASTHLHPPPRTHEHLDRMAVSIDQQKPPSSPSLASVLVLFVIGHADDLAFFRADTINMRDTSHDLEPRCWRGRAPRDARHAINAHILVRDAGMERRISAANPRSMRFFAPMGTTIFATDDAVNGLIILALLRHSPQRLCTVDPIGYAKLWPSWAANCTTSSVN